MGRGSKAHDRAHPESHRRLKADGVTTTTATKHENLLKLVRYASNNAQVAESKRDAAIREAQRAGASLRELAEASGISHMTVKRIIERDGS